MSGTCLSILSDTDIYTATVVQTFEIIEQSVLHETKTYSPYETFVKKQTNNGRISENNL